MESRSFEAIRRLAQREDRRYRNLKSGTRFNGWMIAIFSLLVALIAAAKEDPGVSIVKRLFTVLSFLGFSLVGFSMVRLSYTLTRSRWVKTHRNRMNSETIEYFLHNMNTESELPKKIRDVYDDLLE